MQSLTCLFLLLRAATAIIECAPDGASDALSVKASENSGGGVLQTRSVSQQIKQGKHETRAGLSLETSDKYLIHPQDDNDGKKDVVHLDDISMADLSGLSRDSRGCFVFRTCLIECNWDIQIAREQAESAAKKQCLGYKYDPCGCDCRVWYCPQSPSCDSHAAGLFPGRVELAKKAGTQIDLSVQNPKTKMIGSRVKFIDDGSRGLLENPSR